MTEPQIENEMITEEEKNTLRLAAITNELGRVKNTLKRKGKVITFYKVSFCGLITCLVIFIIIRFDAFTQKKDLNSDHSIKQVSIKSLEKEIVKKYFTVFFENENSHPLAQFEQKARATEFCELLNKINLPKVKIVCDTVLKNKATVLQDTISSNYTIQIGAYSNDILKKYSTNFISINHKIEAGLHKYGIVPFYDYSRCQEFVKSSNLERYYIKGEEN